MENRLLSTKVLAESKTRLSEVKWESGHTPETEPSLVKHVAISVPDEDEVGILKSFRRARSAATKYMLLLSLLQVRFSGMSGDRLS